MRTHVGHIVRSFFLMLFFLGLSTGVALFITTGNIGKENVIMIYLMGVLFTTVTTSSYVFGVLSATAGVILFNYFFTTPNYSLNIDSRTDVVLLGFFFITAIVTGSLMSRLQKQKNIADHNAKTAQQLSEISGYFLHITGKENIIQGGIRYIYEHSGCCAEAILSDGKVYGNKRNQEETNHQNVTSFPIEGTVSVLGRITIYDLTEEAVRNYELLFKAIAEQMGSALNREYFYEEREEIRIAMEKEKLRSALLRAVAHDLRSPLTALSGASSLLADSFEQLSVKEQRELASTISDEMIWLTNLVENILNMTRINESKLVLHEEYEVADDVVGEAVSHMKRLFAQRDFSVTLPDEVIALPMDGKLVSQVLTNLLDNAIKHTAPNDSISLEVERRGQAVYFAVADTGEGIPNDIRDTIFDGFVCAEQATTDGKRGMGLGLAICKAIVEAHNGQIWVEDNIPSGSVFIFTLPMEEENGIENKDTCN